MENRRIIYKVDADGNAISVAEGTYQGNILHYSAGFPNIPQVLTSLEDKFSPRETDVWLLTYLKAGTHWIYEIIGILQSGKLEPLKNFKETLMLEMHTDVSEIENSPPPRILNTHIRFNYLPRNVLEKNKIICLIRNPKSAAVSGYFHRIGIKSTEYKGTFSGFLPLFIQGYCNANGSWFDHVTECWDELKDNTNVHFVFYEELKKNTVEVIEGISKFLGSDRTKEFCEGVAQLTSFEEMHKTIGKDTNEVQRLDKYIPLQGTLFRKGTVDDWKNHFTVAENENFDKIYEQNMQSYPELRARIRFE